MSEHDQGRTRGEGETSTASPSGTPGTRTRVESRYGGIQRKGPASVPTVDSASEVASRGVSGPAERLPFLDVIQRASGRDLGGIEAHVGGPAVDACAELGATAYATGNRVAFATQPDLHTATHEATHVLQQSAGVQLKGGVGESGDQYERQADAAGDAIVRGETIAHLMPMAAPVAGAASVQLQESGGGGGKQSPPKGTTPLVVHVFHKGGKVTTWRGVTDLDDLKGHAFYGGEDENGAWQWNSPLGDTIDLYKDENDRTPTPITSLAGRPSVEFISIHVGARDTEIPDAELVARMSGVNAPKTKKKRTGPVDPDRAFFDDNGKTNDQQSQDQTGAKGGQDGGVTGATGRRHRTGGGQHITGDANAIASSGADKDADVASDSQGQRRDVLDKSGADVGRKTGPKGGASGNTSDAGRRTGYRDGTSDDSSSIAHNENAEKADGRGGNIPEDGGRVSGMAGGEKDGKDGGAPIGMGIWEVLTMSATAARTAYVADLVLSADIDGAVDKLVRAAGKRMAKGLLKKGYLKNALKAEIKKLANGGMARIEERLADVAEWNSLDDAAKNQLRARWRYELEDELHRKIDRELTERIEQLEEVVKDGKHIKKELGEGDDYLDDLVRQYQGELDATMRTRSALREIEAPQGSSSFKQLDDRLADDVRFAKQWNAVSDFWPERRAFDGMMVYRRGDLFDPHFVKLGESNLERMRKGKAPWGTDDRPVEIHHLNQSDEGPVVEILASFHDRHHHAIHINGNDIPSGIDRPDFDNWRSRYWRNRANEIEPRPARTRKGQSAPPTEGGETP